MREIMYLILFVLFIPVVFKVLRGINLERNFKKNHILEIKLAYIIIIVIVSHMLANIFVKIYYLFL